MNKQVHPHLGPVTQSSSDKCLQTHSKASKQHSSRESVYRSWIHTSICIAII